MLPQFILSVAICKWAQRRASTHGGLNSWPLQVVSLWNHANIGRALWFVVLVEFLWLGRFCCKPKTSCNLAAIVLCRWFPRLSCCRTLNCFPPFSIVFSTLLIACVFLQVHRSSASSSSWFTAATFVVCLASQFRRDIAEVIQFCTFWASCHGKV